METIEKLKAIEATKCIYNIHYCNAGVGFCFFEGTEEDRRGDFRAQLKTDRYYPSFEEAVEAEYSRLFAPITK